MNIFVCALCWRTFEVVKLIYIILHNIAQYFSCIKQTSSFGMFHSKSFKLAFYLYRHHLGILLRCRYRPIVQYLIKTTFRKRKIIEVVAKYGVEQQEQMLEIL